MIISKSVEGGREVYLIDRWIPERFMRHYFAMVSERASERAKNREGTAAAAKNKARLRNRASPRAAVRRPSSMERMDLKQQRPEYGSACIVARLSSRRAPRRAAPRRRIASPRGGFYAHENRHFIRPASLQPTPLHVGLYAVPFELPLVTAMPHPPPPPIASPHRWYRIFRETKSSSPSYGVQNH